MHEITLTVTDSKLVSQTAAMARKVLLVFNAYEVTDTEGYNVYRDFAPVLAVLDRLMHFGVLCPLGAAGLVLTWRRRRRLALLYAIGVGLAASAAAFYVFARYTKMWQMQNAERLAAETQRLTVLDGQGGSAAPLRPPTH